jgi:hypothetical protein
MMPITNLAAGQYVYTLTCTGPGGSASASATLNVNAASGKGGGGALSWWMIAWLSALTLLRFFSTRNTHLSSPNLAGHLPELLVCDADVTTVLTRHRGPIRLPASEKAFQ